MELTQLEARRLFDVDAETGALIWSVRSSKKHLVGKIAGTTDKDGQRVVQVRRRLYRVHRVIWLMTHGAWPKLNIDHSNGDRKDLRAGNLRDVPQQVICQNLKRTTMRVHSSQHVGVSWQKSRSKWIATIQIDGKTRLIGRYTSEAEAADARKLAKLELHPLAGCNQKADAVHFRPNS